MNKLINKELSLDFQINPFEIQSIKYKNNEVLYQKDGDWKKTWPIMFPVCGNLKSKLTYEGKELDIIRHGFFNDIKNWKIIQKKESSCLLESVFDKPNKLFPFKYKITIKIRLTKKKVYLDINIKNIDLKKMYYSFGHHPAFIFDKGDTITLNKEEEFIYEFSDGLMFEESDTKKIKSFSYGELDFSNSKPYLAFSKSNSVSIRRSNISYKIHYPKYPIFLFWSINENAKYVCVEPWFGMPDYANQNHSEISEKKQVIILEPGKNKIHKFSIKFD
ncbi:aldose 1-epimerase [Spiroplasma corruscae]|uniref:Aldose 1-epimerase n=1 Tax=Spiroplasma corruscae TaxID=216934 RepID=A0A222EPX3_9MOLU|nr:hypothetical protein [Spiroplasma corruscae]ASP28589.1 aldose 1-epimerase [Spiroplasma corruscae]